MKKHLLLVLGLAVMFGLEAPDARAALSSDAVSKAVAVFFKEAPVMVEVARCESGLRQYDESGRVLRGGYGGGMIGLFQISEVYHREEARVRGYNIDTLVGNMAYARDLYRSEGTMPWDSSSHCWSQSKIVEVVTQPMATSTLVRADVVKTDDSQGGETMLITRTLSYGTRNPEVRILQRFLNKAGYAVTTEGDETDYFGIGTYKALVRFQCDHNLACRTKPDMIRNVGKTGASTREVINSASGMLS